MCYYGYILYSPKLDRFYIGSCENIDVRFSQHNAGRNKSTKNGIPWTLRYTAHYKTRAEAVQREAAIKKKKSRKYIEYLISSVV